MSDQDMLVQAREMLADLPPAVFHLVHHLLTCLTSSVEATRTKWRRALPALLRGENPWSSIEPIELMGEIRVDPVIEFTAKLYFPTANSGCIDGVYYKYVNQEFRDLLEGKVERNIPAARLRVHRLLPEKFSEVYSVAEAVGSEELNPIPLSHFQQTIKLSNQSRGPLRDLVRDMKHFGLCVADSAGRPWWVDCCDTMGWFIVARPFTSFEAESKRACKAIVTP